jgi:hypothetical protein
LFVVGYVIAFYWLSVLVTEDQYVAGFATFIIATSPNVLVRNLWADGLTTAPAFLFTFLGAIVAVKLFRDGSRWCTLPGVALFGLTLATHPPVTVFFVANYLFLYAWFDRSPHGLFYGAAVAAGGLIITGPWWVTAISNHGIGIFLNVAGSIGNDSGWIADLLHLFAINIETYGTTILMAWSLPVLGFLYVLARGRLLLIGWGSAVFFLAGTWFVYFFLALVAAVFVVEVIGPTYVQSNTALDEEWQLRILGVVLVVLFVTGAGLAVSASKDRSSSLDEKDIAALEWTNEHTASNATFVVRNPSVTEWFPYYTERTVLTTRYGVEWFGPERAEQYRKEADAITSCLDVPCIDKRLTEYNLDPDYLVVRQYLADSVRDHPHYTIVFENGGMVVATVDDPEGT